MNMQLPCVLYLIVLLYNFQSLAYVKQDETLQLLFGVFRHGRRTPPFDFGDNEEILRYGFAQLTEEGKREEYMLGKKLREKYKHFLGTEYQPGLINAWATDFKRTKITCRLIIAGLFHPENSPHELVTDINWQPIPDIQIINDDHLLSFPLKWCPKFSEAYRNYIITLKEQNKYSNVLPYLKDDIVLKISSIYDMTVEKHKDDSKTWIPMVKQYLDRNLMESMFTDYLVRSVATTELIQLSGGFLLKNITNVISEKINRSLEPCNLKMVFYSAHDYNIINMLAALNIFDKTKIPDYGAYIIIELHKINETYGTKIFYAKTAADNLTLLQIPGCNKYCSIENFTQLLKANFPLDNNSCNLQSAGYKSNSAILNILLIYIILANMV